MQAMHPKNVCASKKYKANGFTDIPNEIKNDKCLGRS